MARQENLAGVEFIQCSNGATQIVIGNPLPNRLACTYDCLELNAGTVTSSTCDREMKSASDNVDSFLGKTSDHLHYYFYGRMPTSSEDNQALTLKVSK